MNPERWAQIQVVFLQAAKLSADERRLYLDRACAADATLRSGVESLLAADDRSRSPLDGSAMDAFASAELISNLKNHPASSITKGEVMSQRCEKGHFYDFIQTCKLPSLRSPRTLDRRWANPSRLYHTRRIDQASGR